MLVEVLSNSKFFETLATMELYHANLKPEFTPASSSQLPEYFMRFKGTPNVISAAGSASLKNIFLQELGELDFKNMSELHKHIKESRTSVPDVEFDFLKTYIQKSFQFPEEHKNNNTNLSLLTVNHRYGIKK